MAGAAQRILSEDPVDLAYRRHVDACLEQAEGHDSAEAWAAVVPAWEQMSVPGTPPRPGSGSGRH